MFEIFRNAWKVKDLRKKILFTVFIIIIYRIGSVAITAPFLDASVLAEWMAEKSTGGNFLDYLNMLSGDSLSKATLFALSITPYINASIIVQLLTYALPPLERLQKEGEEGRKKLNMITTYVALAIGIFLGYAYFITIKNAGALTYSGNNFEGYFSMAVIMATFVTGSMLIIWLGNEVNDKGIGNGVSMILLAGIISRGPAEAINLVKLMINDPATYGFTVPIVFIIFLAMITFIVVMNNAERRIPIQYAKRVVGRKQYGGQNTHLPVKVAMSGVMPIIFASAFMSLPQTVEFFVGTPEKTSGFYYNFVKFFNSRSISYAVIYFILIIAFNYFYVSMQYNPIEIANNLRQNNGGIPGIRPGKPTSDFIQRVLSKVTLVGAFFLGIIAIFPIFFGMAVPELAGVSMGGTSILIVVSVALETTRTLESQMMVRHHDGFLK